MSAICHVHPTRGSEGVCSICHRSACGQCLVEGTSADVCRTCLSVRALPAEAELQAVGLLDLALAGAWLLFGTTIFGRLLAPFGLSVAGLVASLVLSVLSVVAGFAARSGHPAIRILQPVLFPFDVGFAAALFGIVDWGRLPDRGLVLWLYLAQALVLVGLLGWSVVRVHAAGSRALYEPSYHRLRAMSSEADPTPFPFYWAGSILVWLFLQMAFLVVYARAATAGM